MVPTRHFIITSRALGTLYAITFALSAIFAIPTGNGVLALLGSLSLLALPTFPILFASNYAIAERFWFIASFLSALLTITIGFALSFTNYLPSFLALLLLLTGLYHLLYLSYKFLTSPPEPHENPLNKKYLFISLSIYSVTALASWINAFNL
ncbi:MAG: hypothetical protein ACKOW9_06340 [Candidatus Paceibacterota bacterium]